MNLHEDIQRIKEVMGIDQSSGLVPVETNRFVYHKSNPIFRDQIDEVGLITKGKSETWLSDTPIEGEVIFATNSDDENDWFDSQYDDDIYQIDTTKIDNVWYGDPNFGWGDDNKHIITFDNISKNAIKLIYKGTGENLDTINESSLSPLKRRMGELSKHVRSTYRWLNAKAFNDFDDFLDRVIFSTTRDFVAEFGINDFDEQVKVRIEVTPFVRQHIMDNFLDEIREYYEKEIKG